MPVFAFPSYFLWQYIFHFDISPGCGLVKPTIHFEQEVCVWFIWAVSYKMIHPQNSSWLIVDNCRPIVLFSRAVSNGLGCSVVQRLTTYYSLWFITSICCHSYPKKEFLEDSTNWHSSSAFCLYWFKSFLPFLMISSSIDVLNIVMIAMLAETNYSFNAFSYY
jgi:hypothetical protein